MFWSSYSSFFFHYLYPIIMRPGEGGTNQGLHRDTHDRGEKGPVQGPSDACLSLHVLHPEPSGGGLR